jgi:HEAT repeat protein
MRVFSILVLAVLASGCGKNGPTRAGGKPVDHWVQALRDPNPKVRKTAAFKLGNVGSADPAALLALRGALQDRDAAVRCEVILALLKCGPQAEQAVPLLTEIRQRDPNARVRDYSAKALAKIRGAPPSPQ